jgi:CRP-like cAMP-binding protein
MFFFRQTSNFANASIEALSDLVQDLEEKRYEPGDTLWEAGEPADSSVLVVDGVLECRAEGLEPFTFERGFIVGGLDSLAREPRWYGARSKTPLRVIELPRAHMFDVLEDHVDMAMELVRALAGGVQALLSAIAIRAEAGQRASTGEREEADE